MSKSAIAQLRLAAQHIAQADFEQPEDVVRYMGAMQAQDYAAAKWAIGLRTRSCTEEDIEQAVRDRKILRSWPQRGTIHFVVPEEIRWRLALTSERILKGAERRHENLELTQKDFDRALQLFTDALAGDKQLSRPNLMKVLEDGGISTIGQRGYHILWYLSQTGHLCFGPLEGKQPTFALLDDWVPQTAEITHDEALKRLVEKYFISHGPATVQDLAWWSGLTLTDVRHGLELANNSLESIDVDTTTYYLGRNLEPAGGSNAYLLPGFDEFLLGYKDRSASLHIDHSQLIVPGNNGVFRATLVIDGQVAGTWRKIIRKYSVEVPIEYFEMNKKLPAKSIKQAIRRYTEYLAKR